MEKNAKAIRVLSGQILMILAEDARTEEHNQFSKGLIVHWFKWTKKKNFQIADILPPAPAALLTERSVRVYICQLPLIKE